MESMEIASLHHFAVAFHHVSHPFSQHFPIISPPFSPDFCWRNPELFLGAQGHHDADLRCHSRWMNQWLDHGEFFSGFSWVEKMGSNICVCFCGENIYLCFNGCKIYGSIIFQSLYIYKYILLI
jgi:hypothetical protein